MKNHIVTNKNLSDIIKSVFFGRDKFHLIECTLFKRLRIDYLQVVFILELERLNDDFKLHIFYNILKSDNI